MTDYIRHVFPSDSMVYQNSAELNISKEFNVFTDRVKPSNVLLVQLPCHMTIFTLACYY